MNEIAGSDVPLCVAVERSRADDLVLGLASAGIESRVVRSGGPQPQPLPELPPDEPVQSPPAPAEQPQSSADDRWDVLVGADDLAAASRIADEMAVEEREQAQPAVAVELGPVSRSLLGVIAAVVLLAFFMLAGPRDVPHPSAWFDVGAATAARIRSGELWRTVTAVFLHADPIHLAGNVVAGLVFVTAVGRAFGAGLGALLVLLGAAGANLTTAMVVIGPWSSVGASSATFAALGLAAANQAVTWRRRRPSTRRAWLPVAAALALFGMLGVGERSDVFAHLFGLVLGLVSGAVVTLSMKHGVPRTAWQVAFAAAAVALVVGCWTAASPPAIVGIFP